MDGWIKWRSAFSESEQWLTFRRGEYVIALNLSQETLMVPLAFPGALVLASEADCIIHETGVEMPPDSGGDSTSH